MLRRHPSPRSRRQWTTIPACDSVIEVNTPIAYSGMRASTRPPNAARTTIDRTARATIPALNASRSPRNAKRLGMNPSRARSDDSRGKSAKRRVGGEDRGCPSSRAGGRSTATPVPKTARPICEMTVSCSLGTAPTTPASQDVPRNITPDEDAHDRERRPRVARLGRLEGGHAVRDGLDAGDRAAAVGERAHQEQQPERFGRDRDRRDAVDVRGVAEQRAADADARSAPASRRGRHRSGSRRPCRSRGCRAG